ncbi:hypothetical protein CFC21_049651, partial [Triticum aestivum]|jgi:hypothetical protein
V